MKLLKLVRPSYDLLQLATDFDACVRGNVYPWIFLAVINMDSSVAESISQRFSLGEKRHRDIRIFFSKSTALNHKEKALRLFYAGVSALHHSRSSSLLLGQMNLLQYRLSRAEVNSENLNFRELDLPEFKSWAPQEGQLFVGDECKIYLEHAQLNVQNLAAVDLGSLKQIFAGDVDAGRLKWAR